MCNTNLGTVQKAWPKRNDPYGNNTKPLCLQYKMLFNLDKLWFKNKISLISFFYMWYLGGKQWTKSN